jgi:hypothetical protein
MAQFPSFSSVAKFAATKSLNLSSIPANSVVTETFTVTGLRLNTMIPVVHIPTLSAGLTLLSSRITAKNTLGLTIQNHTNAAINDAAQNVEILGL